MIIDWLEAEYYETWLNELCEKRGVSFDTDGSMAIREEYNRWWVEIKNEYEALPFEVDKWILATPTPRAFGSINNYKLFVSDFESLLRKKEKYRNYTIVDSQIESQRQTMLSFLKGNLEGVEISLRMDYDGRYYATHLRSSSKWAVDSITIERTIDGVEYVYNEDDGATYGMEYDPANPAIIFGEAMEYEVIMTLPMKRLNQRVMR